MKLTVTMTAGNDIRKLSKFHPSNQKRENNKELLSIRSCSFNVTSGQYVSLCLLKKDIIGTDRLQLDDQCYRMWGQNGVLHYSVLIISQYMESNDVLHFSLSILWQNNWTEWFLAVLCNLHFFCTYCCDCGHCHLDTALKNTVVERVLWRRWSILPQD